MNRKSIAAFALLLIGVGVVSYGQRDNAKLPTMLRFLNQGDIVQLDDGNLEVQRTKELSSGYYAIRSINHDHVILRSHRRQDGTAVEVIIAAHAIDQITRIVPAGEGEGR